MLLLLLWHGAAAYTPTFQLAVTRSWLSSSSRAACARASSLSMMADLSTPQNVGEAKSRFEAAYGRPVNPYAQGFVSNMLSGTQFALVAPNYLYSRVFAVGFEALCDEFLAAGTPDDAAAIRSALAAGLGMDPATLKRDAEALLAAAEGQTESSLLAADDLARVAAAQGGFKYTYAFGAGLLTLMQKVEVEPSDEAIDRCCAYAAPRTYCAHAVPLLYPHISTSTPRQSGERPSPLPSLQVVHVTQHRAQCAQARLRLLQGLRRQGGTGEGDGASDEGLRQAAGGGQAQGRG